VERRNGHLVQIRHRRNLENGANNRDERHSEIVDLSPGSTSPSNRKLTKNIRHPDQMQSFNNSQPDQRQSSTNDRQVTATVPPQPVTASVPYEPPSQDPLQSNGYAKHAPAAAPPPSTTAPVYESWRQGSLPPNEYQRYAPQYPARYVPRGFQNIAPSNRTGSRAHGNTSPCYCKTC